MDALPIDFEWMNTVLTVHMESEKNGNQDQTKEKPSIQMLKEWVMMPRLKESI